MDEGPDTTVAPNGVELRSHPFAGGVVRGALGADYLLDADEPGDGPIEVLLEQGVLWANADGSGRQIAVAGGAFRVLVSDGSVVVDSGYSGEALVLVASGTVALLAIDGSVRTLGGGEAGVIEPDGSIAAIDEIDDSELGSDPWVVANIALDAAEQRGAEPEPSDEPDTDEVVPEEPDEVVPEEPDEVVPEEVVDQAPQRPDEAAVVATVLAGLARPPAGGDQIEVPIVSVPSDDDVAEDLADERASGDEDGSDALGGDGEVGDAAKDLPYHDDEEDEPSAGGRSMVRLLEYALLVVVIAVGALIIGLYNRDNNEPAGPPKLGSATSIVAETTVQAPASTEREPTTTAAETATTVARTTTSGPPPTTEPAAASTTSTPPASAPRVAIANCTRQSATRLVASGTASGAQPPVTAYEITVAVRSADQATTYGETTVTVPVEDGTVTWQADIDIEGNITGAGCVLIDVQLT